MSFGELVALMLKECGLDARTGANLLHTTPGGVRNIIAGRGMPTQEFLKKRHWRQQFEFFYPEVWRRHRDAFEREASRLAAVPRRSHKMPVERDTIGFVLWNILGGSLFETDQAMRLLRVTRSQLVSILNNDQSVTQQFIGRREWPARLAEHYNEGWLAFGEQFNERLGKLQPRPGGARRTPEPRDQTSLGHTFWKIIEGRPGRAVHLVGVSRHELRRIFRNQRKAAALMPKLAVWRERFCLHFPKTWELYRAEFEERVRALEASGGNHHNQGH